MNTSALEDIQKALNTIRGDIERADAETKLAALELIMGTRQSVVAMARKLTTPKVKTRTVIVPKKKVTKAKPLQRKVSKKDDEPHSLEPIKPKPPLTNQRVGEVRPLKLPLCLSLSAIFFSFGSSCSSSEAL